MAQSEPLFEGVADLLAMAEVHYWMMMLDIDSDVEFLEQALSNVENSKARELISRVIISLKTMKASTQSYEKAIKRSMKALSRTTK